MLSNRKGAAADVHYMGTSRFRITRSLWNIYRLIIFTLYFPTDGKLAHALTWLMFSHRQITFSKRLWTRRKLMAITSTEKSWKMFPTLHCENWVEILMDHLAFVTMVLPLLLLYVVSYILVFFFFQTSFFPSFFLTHARLMRFFLLVPGMPALMINGHHSPSLIVAAFLFIFYSPLFLTQSLYSFLLVFTPFWVMIIAWVAPFIGAWWSSRARVIHSVLLPSLFRTICAATATTTIASAPAPENNRRKRERERGTEKKI